MTIPEDLLTLLVCPEARVPLSVAGDDLVAGLNARIAAGGVRNRGGKPVERPLAAGLLRQGGDVLYPIVDAIPVLLVEEGILLAQEPER